MLETIKNVIIGIGDFFVSVGPFVMGYIKELTSLFDKLANTYNNVNSLLESFFPVTLIGLFGTLISLVLVLRVVGRF